MALHTRSATLARSSSTRSTRSRRRRATRRATRCRLHELDPDVAYQLVRDELMLDGNARLNLATFVTTWMEPQAAAAHGRDVRQEHDRQGRVPADRGDRACAA